MRRTAVNLSFLAFAGLIVALSIWGPERLANYRDRKILDRTNVETVDTEGEGYRYALSSNEKLYILSECLNSQPLTENGQAAAGRTGAGSGTEMDYDSLTGSYAFIVNHRGPSGQEITDQQIYDTCITGMDELKKLSILPGSVRTVEESSYEAVLYSAIDVLEPRNNVVVWKVSLSTSQKNADKENRLIDAYIDADDGKFYEFYVRTPLTWEDINPDDIMEQWSGYMGLTGAQPYEAANPLMETTPYFKKYILPGMGEGKTIVTIGFYEGINELFLKISR